MKASGVEAKRPQIHEHFMLMIILEMLGCFDQVNLEGLFVGTEPLFLGN